MKKIIMCIWAFMAVSGVWASDDSIELSKLQPDFTKWEISNASKLGLKDGYIQMVLTGGYPMFFTPAISIDASKIKILSFKMKLAAKNKLSGNILFITSDDKNWSDEKLAHFESFDDGEVHEYNVDMSKNKNWKGTVTKLRFTPVYIPSFEVWSDSKKYFDLGDGFKDTLSSYSWKWDKFGLCQTFNSCCIPTGYADLPASTKKLEFENMMKARNADAKIVFLGDSITYLWQSNPTCQNGSKLWTEKYVPMNVQNCALSGDKTENTLWQLTEGKALEGMNPSVFVVLIGINNAMTDSSASAIAAGIKSITAVLQKNFPDAKILLLGLLPTCLEWDKTDVISMKSQEINRLVSKFADNRNIIFLDMRKSFLKEDGKVDSSMFYDGLHLTEKGFTAWDNTMMPVLQQMLSK